MKCSGSKFHTIKWHNVRKPFQEHVSAKVYYLYEIRQIILLGVIFPRELQIKYTVQFSSVQSFSCVQLFVTPWTAAHQASLSIVNSRSLLRLMCIELVMPSNHLILCCTLLLPPSIFPSIRAFSNESVLHIRWPKHISSPSNLLPRVNWGSRCFTVTTGLEGMKSRIETQPHSAQTTGLCLLCVSH